MLSKTLFNKVIYKGIMGALFGIVAGLILGVLIFGLTASTSYIYNYSFSSFSSGTDFAPGIQFIIVLGMGFGAIIGSIFGSLTAYKENK